MALETYLHACLKNGRTVRWSDKAMPIRVYIAPFQWYQTDKRRQAAAYEALAEEAMATWQRASGGLASFERVRDVRDSQMDVRWRRVDRKTLGHCEYLVHKNFIVYSAEISIGITDGRVHQDYDDAREVRHTILHEFGHALGLIGHSDGPADIMYAPHQYGIDALSPRDEESIRQLYRLPPGFDPASAARHYRLSETASMNELLSVMAGLSSPSPTPAESLEPPAAPVDPEALDRHHRILSERGRFHLATQHIRPQPDPPAPQPEA